MLRQLCLILKFQNASNVLNLFETLVAGAQAVTNPAPAAAIVVHRQSSSAPGPLRVATPALRCLTLQPGSTPEPRGAASVKPCAKPSLSRLLMVLWRSAV